MVAATSARLTLLSRRWLIETFEEAPKARGKFPPHHFAALPQLFGDVSGDIARPAFSGVEADDPDRICILAAQQVANDGLVIRRFCTGLAPDSADLAEIIDNQINILLICRDD